MSESTPPPAIDSARHRLWLRTIEADIDWYTRIAYLTANGKRIQSFRCLFQYVFAILRTELSTLTGRLFAVVCVLTVLSNKAAQIWGDEQLLASIAPWTIGLLLAAGGLHICSRFPPPIPSLDVKHVDVSDESLGRRTDEPLTDFPLPLRFAAAFDQVFQSVRWSDRWRALPPDGRPDLVALRRDCHRRACRLEEKMLARRVDNEGRDLFRVDYGTVAELFPDDVNDLLAKLEYIDQYRIALHDGARASGALADDHSWLALRSSTADLEAQSAILDSLDNLAQLTAQPQPLNTPKPDSDPA